MADDVTTQSATLASVPAGGVYAFDLINGVLYARSKTGWGADGSYVDTSAANPLPVVQTGTPTLPTGASTLAEQQTQTASLGVMDDWDESDRAKVNPIAGQAGVQGGSGGVTALTQRVVLATDVALPAGTNAIGKLAANSGVDIGDVDVTSLPALPAGSNLIGSVTTKLPVIVIPSSTITVSTSPAYTASPADAVGGKLTFSSAALANGGSFLLQSVWAYDLSQQKPTLELWLFNQDFTASTDNAAFDPTDADLANLACPPIVISAWHDANDNSVAGRFNLAIPITLVGVTTLYGQLLTRTAVTFVGTSDIKVAIGLVQST